MQTVRSFFQTDPAEEDNDGVNVEASTSSYSSLGLGRLNRLRVGTESALNHLVYGKWRKYNINNNGGRMPILNALVGDKDEAICWLLGRAYTVGGREEEPTEEGAEETEEMAAPENAGAEEDEFLADFQSLIWLTYREHFPPLRKLVKAADALADPPPITTTDCGWGCMLRSAQMLVAQALVQLRLGRDFRLNGCSFPDFQAYTSVIRLFEDCPHSPLGIHALVEMARRREWEPADGHWFSASQAALLLKDALLVGVDETGAERKRLSDQLAITIAVDNCLVQCEMREAAKQWAMPLLVVVPLRLGTECVNQLYMEHIRFLFTLDTFVGMLCGRPKNAAYLVGCLDNFVLCLDPHVVQSYKPLDDDKTDEQNGEEEKEQRKRWTSFQCSRPGSIPLDELDPSCALGFLLRSEEQMAGWLHEMAENGLIQLEGHEPGNNAPNGQPSSAPLFTVLRERPEFDEQKIFAQSNTKRRRKNSKKKKTSKAGENNDFELL